MPTEWTDDRLYKLSLDLTFLTPPLFDEVRSALNELGRLRDENIELRNIAKDLRAERDEAWTQLSACKPC